MTEADTAAGWRRRIPWASVVAGLALVALAARVITPLVLSRGWFFTNDDWDYATRGIGDVLAPHQGHLNVLNALSSLGLRAISGLDFWPSYGLVVSLAWPVLAAVAWWWWRRSGVEPVAAAVGTVLLCWLGSAAYMQFSHVNPAWALAATLVALEYDEASPTRRNLTINVVASLIAVFANTLGALAAAVRFILAAIRRQWTGAIGAGIAVAAYTAVRVAVGGGGDPSFGPGDVLPSIRVGLGLVGHGLDWVVPLPNGLEVPAAMLLAGAATTILVVTRLSHRSAALLLTAGVWLATAVVAGYLNTWTRPRFESLMHGFPNANLIWPRFTNIVVVVIVLAGVPLISKRLRGRRTARLILLVILAGLLSFNVARSIQTFRTITAVAAEQAAVAGGLVAVEASDESALTGFSPMHPGTAVGPASIRRVDRTDGTLLPPLESSGSLLAARKDLLQGIARSGDVASLLSSDAFSAHGVRPDVEWARATRRFRFENRGEPRGSWFDLGVDEPPGRCIALTSIGELQVTQTTTFQVVVPATQDAPDADVLVFRQRDENGVAAAGLIYIRPTSRPRSVIAVTVLGPGLLTVSGPETAEICHHETPPEP